MDKILAFFLALISIFTGPLSVSKTVGTEPITAAGREYRFDRDGLILGVYGFPKDDKYDTLLEWFKDASLDFYVGLWGDELNDSDLDELEENGLGIIAPNNAYYRGLNRSCIWGIDLYDEPNSADFAALAEQVENLYAEDANRLPLINLLPMYAAGGQLGDDLKLPGAVDRLPIDGCNVPSYNYRTHLAKYVSTVDSDVISADVYPLNIDAETGELSTYEYWLRNLDILADACRSTGRDLWIITQAASFSENGNGPHRGDTPEDQRWQNYVSLSFGAKAIIYGCYYTGWWDPSSHMIDDGGSRTSTYYAVKQVNEEMAPIKAVYGDYDYTGTFILNRLDPNAAGAGLGLTRFDCRFKPTVVTADPVLCGCFSEKNGNGSAFVFTNMYEPQTGKDASFTAFFPGAKSISVFRKGEVTHVDGSSISLTLENREGVFVTVEKER